MVTKEQLAELRRTTAKERAERAVFLSTVERKIHGEWEDLTCMNVAGYVVMSDLDHDLMYRRAEDLKRALVAVLEEAEADWRAGR